MAGRREAWRSYAAGSEVLHFSKFCREHLIQSEDRWEGKPLLLEAWQRRMLGEALAYDENGQPLWRSVVMIAPRKNGKTALLVAVAIYRLLTDEGRPEILLAASSDRQAGRLFDAFLATCAVTPNSPTCSVSVTMEGGSCARTGWARSSA
jgi:phage terminase large subunit-like protein